MSLILFLEQILNGLGYGLMLFLLAAGLTLVFGIMDVMNLAHGSLFMAGAYVAAQVHSSSNSFVGGVLIGVAVVVLLAMMLELLLVRHLYGRDHLAQVLATYGVILIADDVVKAIWGAAAIPASMPAALSQPVHLLPELPYPAYRLFLLVSGLLLAFALYLLVNRTRIGMHVRAGASNRAMAEFMGVRVDRVFSFVFLLGAMLAALAGALMGPITAVQVGMGEEILVPSLVVLVIGGIGSIRGAFVAALLVGMVDTMGRAFVPVALRSFMSPVLVSDVAPAVAGLATYALMAGVLAFKPSGLFPARG
ncbi:branched-chain amino acid ABC transporter permease [soil metagenome]